MLNHRLGHRRWLSTIVDRWCNRKIAQSYHGLKFNLGVHTRHSLTWDHASGLPGLMTPCYSQSTWLCCCSRFNCSACGCGTLTCSPDMLLCPRPAVFNSLETAGVVEIRWMIGYEKPTDIYSWGADLLHPRQLLWLLLFAMLVIYDHLTSWARFG